MDFDILLTDIEGTTTSISFVKDVLFPYAKAEAEAFLRKNWDSEMVQADVELLRKQAQVDIADGQDGISVVPEGSLDAVLPSVLANVCKLMEKDRKVSALKQLQGHIWVDGYESGVLRGHIYADVKPALQRLISAQKKIYIYSSGSVDAQKLLFRYSDEGDISQLFSGHFDTAVGLKFESKSYNSIAREINADASRILFLTDIVNEAIAATEAGFQVRLVSRPGNAAISEDDRLKYGVITSFEAVKLS